MQILDQYVNENKDAGEKDNKINNTSCGAGKSPVQPQPAAELQHGVNSTSLPEPPGRRQKKEADPSPSEVNFNQPKSFSSSNVVGKQLSSSIPVEKHYDDKVIPGQEKSSLKSSVSKEITSSSALKQNRKKEPQESVTTSTSVSSNLSSSSCGEEGTELSFSSSNWRPTDFSSVVSSWVSDDKDVDIAIALIGTPNFTYSELCSATNSFHLDEKLGEGAFGTVYCGILRGQKCAIKKLQEDTRDEQRKEHSQQLRSELTALLRYRHENIVTLYGYALDGPSLCLVYQYMAKGSLEDRLQCKGDTAPLSWAQRINIAVGAAHGLQFLHNMGDKPLIHGDIKSANILLDKHFEAKVGDLGQAQHANSGAMTGKFTHITKKDMNSKIYGTRAYFPPELLRGDENLSIKTDVYAFGVVMLEICTGERAYDERREPNKFLASHFYELTDDGDEKDWPSFCDRRAGQCPESIIIKLLKVAKECVAERKKSRPETRKLATMLVEIEEKYQQITEVRAGSPSSSIHVGPNLSHTSGSDYSHGNADDNTAANPMIHGMVSPAVGNPGANQHGDQSSLLSPTAPFRAKPSPNIHGINIPEDVIHQGQGSSLPFPTDVPPYELQKWYDEQNKNKEGENRQGEYWPCHQPQSSASYCQSDPQKLAEIQKHEQQLRLMNPIQQSPQSAQHVPSQGEVFKSDPRKMEALKLFDAKNRLVGDENERVKQSTEADEDSELHIPASDPEKLRQILKFDVNNMTDESSQNKLLEATSHGIQYPQVQSGEAKLKYIQQFDAKNVDSHTMYGGTGSAAQLVTSRSDMKQVHAVTGPGKPGHPAKSESGNNGYDGSVNELEVPDNHLHKQFQEKCGLSRQPVELDSDCERDETAQENLEQTDFMKKKMDDLFSKYKEMVQFESVNEACEVDDEEQTQSGDEDM